MSRAALGLIRISLQKASLGTINGSGGSSDNGSDSKFCLSSNTATWLCWRAFHDIFQEQEDFTDLSSCLSLELAKKGQHVALHKVIAGAFQEFADLGLLPSEGMFW